MRDIGQEKGFAGSGAATRTIRLGGCAVPRSLHAEQGDSKCDERYKASGAPPATERRVAGLRRPVGDMLAATTRQLPHALGWR